MNWLQLVFTVLSAVLVTAVAVKVYLRNAIVLVKKGKKRLDGKVAIVTGSNTGIGLETAKFLVRRGVRVILACRDITRAEKAAEEIRGLTKNADVAVRQLDLGSLDSVRAFCDTILREEKRLDILVNNAGASFMTKVVTSDGLEKHMAVNHFGPFLLTNILLALMKTTDKARIINVASTLHKWPGKFDLENLNSEKVWEPATIYAKTKLCNVLFSQELNKRLINAGVTGITTNSLHPGAVRTRLFRDVKKNAFYNFLITMCEIFFKSPWEGAQTSIHLAISEEVEGMSGLYWNNCQIAKPSKLGGNPDLAKALWDISAKIVKLRPNENHLSN